MQNDTAHQLSPSEGSWQVMVQDVAVKNLGFLTLEPPLKAELDRPSRAGCFRIRPVFDRTEQDKDHLRIK